MRKQCTNDGHLVVRHLSPVTSQHAQQTIHLGQSSTITLDSICILRSVSEGK